MNLIACMQSKRVPNKWGMQRVGTDLGGGTLIKYANYKFPIVRDGK